jgi:hypothetical protein
MPTACSIWPPNGKMVSVRDDLGQRRHVAAGCVSASRPSSSEGPDKQGVADTEVAGSGLGAQTVSLRASRSGNGGVGRTYTITANATDEAGNSASATATCVVPHNM